MNRSKVSGLEGDDQEIFVFVLLKLFFLEYYSQSEKESRASRDKESPPEKLGGQPVSHEESCRASLPETPPVESGTESASWCGTTGRRSTKTTPVPEQQPKEASLEVEVTQIERGPHDHLPQSRDIIGLVKSASRGAGT